MAKIFVTRRIPGNALDELSSSGHEVIVSEYDRPLNADEFLERGKGSDALLTLLTDVINGEVIDAMGPQLKIISNYAVGFDNIEIADATTKGVVVTNTPSDEVSESVAEHTIALVLAIFNRIVEADRVVRQGGYNGWNPDIFMGGNLTGKTFGIIGLGRIGTTVARRLVGFEMKIIYTKRSRDEEAEKKLGLVYATLESLLAESDVISLHVPLTSETRHMINKDTLAKIKRGAVLVNTSRGSVIDEGDLAAALRDGQLGGAALDVYDNEPNINPELINMDNTVLTPHIASATHEARDKMGQQAVTAILDVLAGKMPENIVNKEVWPARRH